MNFTALKQNLQEAYDAIVAKINDNQLPEVAEVNTFVRLTTQMHMTADEGWVDQAEDFAHLATEFLQAVKKGQLEDAVMLIESLNEAQTYCHRTFKD
ncbi:GAK system XXXCH domain-containing protein [Desulfovibrio inopinatus]|uniref:GAK system XXXCH domain-containing protein n=1 Tax=Desulfovibrio inopinatus TaxID=102109 RepID=UPI00041E9B62|nr:GAK system XXXCH domain-containing protein [Desulfovibrio inopinatus]